MELISPEQFDRFVEALNCIGLAIIIAAVIRGILNK